MLDAVAESHGLAPENGDDLVATGTLEGVPLTLCLDGPLAVLSVPANAVDDA